MSLFKPFFFYSMLLLVSSCGGGGGGGSAPAQVASAPNPAPTIALSLALAQAEINENVLITYSSTNASTCDASGDWSGSKGTSGSEQYSSPEAGSFTFTLSCTGSGGTAESSATLQVEKYPDGINLRGASLIFPGSSNIRIAMNGNGRVLAVSRVNEMQQSFLQVYEWDTDRWLQKGADISKDYAISSIQISEDGLKIAFVSAQPYSYQWDGVEWKQTGEIIKAAGSISMSGDGGTIALRMSDPNRYRIGLVEIYEWSDQAGWSLKGEEVALRSSACNVGGCNGYGAFFGNALDLNHNGSAIIVGAPGAPHETPELCDIQNQDGGCPSGAISIFDFKDESWQQRGENLFGDVWGGDFGTNVSISGDGNRISASGRHPNINFGSITPRLPEVNWMFVLDWKIESNLGGWVSAMERTSPTTLGHAMEMSTNGERVFISNKILDYTIPFVSLNTNGVIVIVSPSSNESIGDIVGDDANKKIGRTLISNLTGTIMATSGEDFVNVYTVVL
tara:strand:+ start:2111 stop:3628 length:1518 start_codon:yes stop_codon:yes gene_type:complete